MDQNIQKFDLTIIGASISANYLAYLLSKTKINIAVIEEHDEIGRPLQCAGIVSQKLTQLIDVPNHIILNRVKIAKIIAPSGKYIRLSGDEKPYIIDRIALDQLFYEKIKNNKNISYFLGEKFKSFEYLIEGKKKIVFIETTKRKIKTKMVIGCDGPLSTVGKLLGVINKNIYASQIRVKNDRFNKNEAIMHFNPKWKELFGWIVPEGNDIYRIGLATSKNLNKKFNSFLKSININKKNIIDKQGGLIPCGKMNRIAFDNILLVGDSACQVKATTGGGIIMLLKAVKYAAYCINECFKRNNFSKKNLKKYYEKPVKMTIGKQLKVHYIIRTILEYFSKVDFDRFFQIVKTKQIENIISFYGDMDFPFSLAKKMLMNYTVLKFLIKLIKKKPKLLLKLIKSILF